MKLRLAGSGRSAARGNACGWLLALLLALAAYPAGAASIAGVVTGCSGQHSVYVALFGPDLFSGGEPVVRVVRPSAEVQEGRASFKLEASPGWYTVAVFEDRNGNGDLDMGMFGPKEPAAFHRPHTSFGPPRFQNLRFELRDDQSGIEIALPKR